MLKKISVSAICLLFTISTVIAQDKKDFLKGLVDHIISIKDARDILEREAYLSNFLDSMSLQDTKFISSNAQYAKWNDNDNSSRALAPPPVSTHINKDSLKTKLNNLLKTSCFNQWLKPPYSHVALPSFSSNIINDIIDIPVSKIGISKTRIYNNKFDIIIHKVYYSDGTIDEFYNKVFLKELYTGKNAKCIDSLQVEIIVNYPANIQQVSLSKENSTFGTSNSYVQLISMKDKGAEILLSNTTNRITTIQAKSKEGMVLDYVSDDMKLANYPPAMSAYYQKMVHLCKAIIKDIDERKYDSLDKLKKDIFDTYSIDAPVNSDWIIWTQFEKTINQIDICYIAEMDSVKVFGTLINGDLQSAKNPYHTATDPETDQYGIVDNSGNWIVEPQYDYALPFQGEYAYVEKKYGEAMLIDKSNTIYKKLPSRLDRAENLSGSDPADTRYYLKNEMVLDGYGNDVKFFHKILKY
ncbi:WG repeat-containing protein [Dysgonomonas sp. GY617]|uniref:WG repeat-containing protein n=1 Tax=Dysgonomonas sp. GY617 TaxID=2780420 RepID=UPI0018831CB6|nr:WG repeat-containing protein [Dysgonomonas sp. GY617]MBF0575507.1 WG repeat-containing protein [Dysgonomonas sp. GY617]